MVAAIAKREQQKVLGAQRSEGKSQPEIPDRGVDVADVLKKLDSAVNAARKSRKRKI